MIKNILILILVGILAFFIVSSRAPQENTLNTAVNAPEQENVTSTEKNRILPSIAEDSLDLSGQGLEKLPSYVLDRKSLEELDISDNNLTGALPAEIRHLSNLRVLNASNNRMTGVPAEVGQLEKLEVLDLSDNQLTGLPYEMGNLKNLKILDLSGNDYAEQDLERIRQGLPSDVEIIL